MNNIDELISENTYDFYINFLTLNLHELLEDPEYKELNILYKLYTNLVINYNIEDLYLSPSDKGFLEFLLNCNLTLVSEINEKELKDIRCKLYIIFCVSKYLSVNKLKNPIDFSKFSCRTSNISIHLGKDILDEFRKELSYVFKLIGSEKIDKSKLLNFIENSSYVREIGYDLCDLCTCIINTSGKSKNIFLKEIRSKDFFYSIQAIFNLCLDMGDISKFQLKFDGDGFSKLFDLYICSLLVQDGSFVLSVELSDIHKNTFDDKDYTEENKNLKELIKENRRIKHSELENSNLFETDTEDSFEEDSSFLVEDNYVKVDFNVSLEDKKVILDSYNILFLKSKEIDIDLDLKNTRVYNIENVPQEVFSSSVEYVVIDIKGVSHSDVFRVKSLCKGINIIYTSRINNKLIIEDIFSRI